MTKPKRSLAGKYLRNKNNLLEKPNKRIVVPVLSRYAALTKTSDRPLNEIVLPTLLPPWLRAVNIAKGCSRQGWRGKRRVCRDAHSSGLSSDVERWKITKVGSKTGVLGGESPWGENNELEQNQEGHLQASSYEIELWASLDKLRMSGNIVLKRTPKLELTKYTLA